MLKIHVYNVVYITKFYFKRKIIYLANSDTKVTYET